MKGRTIRGNSRARTACSRVDSLYDKKMKAGGARVKVVESKGKSVTVRTMSGEENWVDAATVE